MVGRPGKYQPRFTSGELDRLFEGNTDQGDYFKGAALMRNVRPFPQGGFGHMWGTKKIARARTAGDGAVSPISIRSFTRSRASAFDVVFTDGFVDIVGTSAILASVATPYSGAQAREMTDAQQLDTMLIAHPDVKPKRLERTVDDLTWTIDDAPYVNTPDYDYGDVYANGVASVWALSFFNAAVNNQYVVTVNGVDSPINFLSGNFATDAANILAAVQALPGVFAGVTMTIGPAATPGGAAVPTGYYGLEFTGDGNEGDGWAISGKVMDNANAAVIASHVRIGKLGGEPIMSVARSWPGAILLYGGRSILAGFKSAPNVFLPSQVDNYFNLDTRLKTASAPFVAPLDAKGAATILHLHHGRTLIILTDSGEYWLQTPTLDKTAPPTVVLATTHGISPTCRPVENEGATYFVDASEGAIQEFRFDFNQQNYGTRNISIRASSLVRDIVDLTVRKRQRAIDTAQLHAVRADGIAAIGHILSAEEIAAFTRRETRGQFKAASVNDRREVTYAVVRDVGNGEVQFIERENENYLLDCCQDFALGAPGVVVAGLADFEGQEVWAVADNVPQGPFVVVGGAITLQVAATSGYVGRWTPPRLLTLPQPRSIGPNTVQRRPCRVHTVRLRLVDTSSVAIGANGYPPFDVPLTRYGAAANVPLLLAPFSGEVPLEGLQGFSDDGIVEITQLRPGKLNVTGITVEVDL
jgi:hypothetical protein